MSNDDDIESYMKSMLPSGAVRAGKSRHKSISQLNRESSRRNSDTSRRSSRNHKFNTLYKADDPMAGGRPSFGGPRRGSRRLSRESSHRPYEPVERYTRPGYDGGGMDFGAVDDGYGRDEPRGYAFDRGDGDMDRLHSVMSHTQSKIVDDVIRAHVPDANRAMARLDLDRRMARLHREGSALPEGYDPEKYTLDEKQSVIFDQIVDRENRRSRERAKELVTIAATAIAGVGSAFEFEAIRTDLLPNVISAKIQSGELDDTLAGAGEYLNDTILSDPIMDLAVKFVSSIGEAHKLSTDKRRKDKKEDVDDRYKRAVGKMSDLDEFRIAKPSFSYSSPDDSDKAKKPKKFDVKPEPLPPMKKKKAKKTGPAPVVEEPVQDEPQPEPIVEEPVVDEPFVSRPADQVTYTPVEDFEKPSSPSGGEKKNVTRRKKKRTLGKRKGMEISDKVESALSGIAGPLRQMKMMQDRAMREDAKDAKLYQKASSLLTV